MRIFKTSLVFLSSFIGVILIALSAEAQIRVQSQRLQAGWNAVYLEVVPRDADPASVFAGFAIESVWTHTRRDSTTRYISDPNQPIEHPDRWLRWVPSHRVESRFNTMTSMSGNRAYLVHLEDSVDESVLWQVEGEVLESDSTWAGGKYNLRGVPCHEFPSTSFGSFFQDSTAHKTENGLQPIYRLKPDGSWIPVAESEAIHRGEAYWIYTNTASQYNGSFTTGPTSRSLISESLNGSLELSFQNVHDQQDTLSLSWAGATLNPPLQLQAITDRLPNQTTAAIPSQFSILVNPGLPYSMTLTPFHRTAAGLQMSGYFTVKSPRGTQHFIPLRIAGSN